MKELWLLKHGANFPLVKSLPYLFLVAGVLSYLGCLGVCVIGFWFREMRVASTSCLSALAGEFLPLFCGCFLSCCGF